MRQLALPDLRHIAHDTRPPGAINSTNARKTLEAERTFEATWRSEIRTWKLAQVPLTGVAAGLALHYAGQGLAIAVGGAVVLITVNLCLSLLAEVRRLNRRIDAVLVLRSPQNEA